MSRILSWVGPALLATTLVAQQPPPPSKSPPASGAATAAERFAALQADQKKVISEWQAKAKEAQAAAKEAQAAGKPVPALPMRPDFTPLVEQAMAAAKDFAGTDDAVQFLVYVVQNASVQSGAKREEGAAAAALLTLADKHIDSAGVASLAPMFGYLPQIVGEEPAKQALAKFAKSSNPDVCGWILYSRLENVIEKSDRDGDAYKDAKTKLQEAAELATDKRLKREIGDAIDIREKFGIGNVAPDIEGKDLDGVAFKLSDYKGKVVFLDFWGDW